MSKTIVKVPTGYIATNDFSAGKLEYLSIGDYGQTKNIKADFLGISEEINGVPNGEIMPLEEKWVITISTQYGCSMGCTFCDVPKVGRGRNASFEDMRDQILQATELFPEVLWTKRLNVHLARMGEPTFNPHVFELAEWLAANWLNPANGLGLMCKTLHPVLTTMMPRRNKMLGDVVTEWCNHVKNDLFAGDANLQVSINSTSDEQRDEMFGGETTSLEGISRLVSNLDRPRKRKYCLNFAMADDYEYNASKLSGLFDPEYWMVKITPIHVNHATTQNGIKSTGGYELYDFYAPREEAFKAAGFDTLVFVPSYDEDFGMITCGNVILSGRMPEAPHTVWTSEGANHERA